MIAILTGLLAGIVHVWSGPDHLAAIAPLAVRRPKETWVPGANWGERLVGVMLIGIGAWALRKALRVHAHEHEHDGERHLHLHTHVHQKDHNQPTAHAHHTHAALGIGILHGLAGSSHFLAVLPLLALPTRTQAAGYLIAFAVGTILS